MFDRAVFFASVRQSLFGGEMTQSQVSGMNFKLDVWELKYPRLDLRWLANPLAQAYHETGKLMVPVREGFKKTDAEARAFVKKQGYKYAEVDKNTGEVYYGRGDIQQTWATNYKKSTKELGLTGDDDLYWHPDRALDPMISAACMYMGMMEGWYRGDKTGRHTLKRYFDNNTNDAFNAREIINGDKNKVPSWSNGVSIGNLVKKYHTSFLEALDAAWVDLPPAPEPEPEPEPEPKPRPLAVLITGRKVEIAGDNIEVWYNGDHLA